MATCVTCGSRLRTAIQHPVSSDPADYCIVCQPRDTSDDPDDDPAPARTGRVA